MDSLEKPPILTPEQRDALIFCERIQRAIAAAATTDNTPASEAVMLADHVIQASVFGGLGYKLEIAIPESITAQVSRDWIITIPRAHHFVASEVRYIGPDKVDFHNIDSDEWLTVFGHQLDISPLFER